MFHTMLDVVLAMAKDVTRCSSGDPVANYVRDSSSNLRPSGRATSCQGSSTGGADATKAK